MLAEKTFNATEEIMAETEAYFVDIPKSNYKKGIEKLYDRYSAIIIVSPSKGTILKALSCGGPLITVATQLDDIFVCMEI
jgi:UDP-N-acetylglucosamine transferase subunit ALG13